MSCSNNQQTPEEEWQSALYLDHPLIGKIWSSGDGGFTDASTLMTAASGATYLLLGEKHDNPDHHRLQRSMVEQLLRQQRVSTVAFEMLEQNKQDLLDEIQLQQFSSLQELKDYLQWDEQGWDWSFYGPLLNAAYSADVKLAAANIDSDTMMEIYAGDLPEEIGEILAAEVIDRLNSDIDESHCGLLPASQFPAMVRVQQTRDNTMAGALGRPEANKLNILIAGNYHVRRDLGVPNYLLAAAPGIDPADVVSIAFMEVDPGSTDPQDYLQQFTTMQAYDYIWFTPAISNEDYCASLQSDQ